MKPNKKLSTDMSVYEDNHTLKQVCRKGSSYLDTANCKALWEIKSLDAKARWICNSIEGSGQHVDWWASPREVIAAEIRGESGCPHCREIATEEWVPKATWEKDLAVQEKHIASVEKKTKRNLVGRGPVAPEDRYTL